MVFSISFLHWVIGVSFLIGNFEFLITFFICRKLFIKTMTGMNLSEASL